MTAITHFRDTQTIESQTHIEIFTDGSCIGNPGPGGYGAVILRLSTYGSALKRRELQGVEPKQTTNIRMEITAVCAALECLGSPTAEPIIVKCDANLIPNAMNGWLANWKNNNWRKSDKKPVENRDLWERLEEAVTGRKVEFQWLRGHAGAQHNERADQLANASARKAELAQ